jgi:hypothetical protein
MTVFFPRRATLRRPGESRDPERLANRRWRFFILNFSVDRTGNNETIEKTISGWTSCAHPMGESDFARRMAWPVGRAYLPDIGASSGEGASSTARCRASMPDLQTEEFRFIVLSMYSLFPGQLIEELRSPLGGAIAGDARS